MSSQLSSTVSYSRLSTYAECPAKFKYRYVVKPDHVYVPLEDYFIKGTLAHECVEEYLLHRGAKEDILEMIIPSWLISACKFDESAVHMATPELDSLNYIDVQSLTQYARIYGYLLHRASANYHGVDAIRNNDGTVPKDPHNFPPKQLRSEYERHQLPGLKMAVDNTAAIINPEFRRFSLCDTAAQAAACFYNFSIPDWVDEITGVEYTSDQKLGWDEDTKEWAWFVDLSYTTQDGDEVISDHKTGKTKPSGLDVAFHPQLNLYAYLWNEAKDRMPKYLAINHLPSGDVVAAAVDLKIVLDNYEHFKTIQQSINLAHQHDCWPARLPTEYNSPCIKRDWKTQQVTSVCPYLQLCHPRYVDYVKDEVKHLLKLNEGNGDQHHNGN